VLSSSKLVSKFSMSLNIFGFSSCHVLNVSFTNFASASSLYIVSSFIISICVLDRVL